MDATKYIFEAKFKIPEKVTAGELTKIETNSTVKIAAETFDQALAIFKSILTNEEDFISLANTQEPILLQR